MSTNATSRSTRFAITCQIPLFRAFLRTKIEGKFGYFEDWHKLETQTDAAIAVRYLLEIDSRREINLDPAVGKKWDALDAEYEFWKRGM
ncbi:MAG: hypothetical protein GY748_26005 [Planctomycetaceae bacterium]|nr:hypothetical protein [Planctomycetaceae bacterium]